MDALATAKTIELDKRYSKQELIALADSFGIYYTEITSADAPHIVVPMFVEGGKVQFDLIKYDTSVEKNHIFKCSENDRDKKRPNYDRRIKRQ